MRAVRPAAMALLSVVILVIVIVPRPALASPPPASPTSSLPPRATSLPGADAPTSGVEDILASAAIVLVSGIVGIAGLMWRRQ